MSFGTLLGIAVALAMDAFAVAIGVGISLKNIKPRQFFRLSWHFGLFQALMPVAGWWLGNSIHSFVENFAHWIAFFLLAAVGTNMLREAMSFERDTERLQKDATKGITLIILSVATSIDALAVGFSLSMLNSSIVTPAIVIGLVALTFTLLGMVIGQRVASFERLGTYAELIGGLVLWFIGIRILLEHGLTS